MWKCCVLPQNRKKMEIYDVVIQGEDLMDDGELILKDSETRPQSQPLQKDQVQNSAGGYVWKVDDWVRLKRFLCLGSESGTYYVGSDTLRKQNVECITCLISEGKGKEVVETIKTYSVEGRVAKQNSLLLALALCARSSDVETKAAAYRVLTEVCRIPTFLFQFVNYCEKVSEEKEERAGTGWGRAHRRAICQWYSTFSKDPMRLAYLVTKYWQRGAWSHRDVIRLCHIKPENEAVGFIVRFATKGLAKAKEMYIKEDTCRESDVYKVYEFIEATERAKAATEEEKLIELIKQHNLAREHCPTRLLNSPLLWRQLLQNMPMTAMIRNLGKMSKEGLLKPDSEAEGKVLAALENKEAIKKARIHPFTILNALSTYKGGQGVRGHLSWEVNERVVQALDQAFYSAFEAVEPTGKRYLLGLDVSGSMQSPCSGSSLSCAEAAAAMLMVTLRTEPHCEVNAFCHKFVPLDISKEDDLTQVLRKTRSMTFGSTDCAVPILWALQNKKKIDVFVVYTDSETWIGMMHPAEALRQYRKDMGVWQARLIVVAMTSSGFTIADPEDPGMLDVVGFDTSAPEAMRAFVMGEV